MSKSRLKKVVTVEVIEKTLKTLLHEVETLQRLDADNKGATLPATTGAAPGDDGGTQVHASAEQIKRSGAKAVVFPTEFPSSEDIPPLLRPPPSIPIVDSSSLREWKASSTRIEYPRFTRPHPIEEEEETEAIHTKGEADNDGPKSLLSPRPILAPVPGIETPTPPKSEVYGISETSKNRRRRRAERAQARLAREAAAGKSTFFEFT